MTTFILLMLWGTLTESQRHDFLVRMLESELDKDTNLVYPCLVTLVKSALDNQYAEDEVLDKILEVMKYDRTEDR